MTKETAGIIVMLVCYWGVAATFWGIGCYDFCAEKPVNFWAGVEIDPKTVADIPGYNHSNAKMWQMYSVPYWLAGLVSIWNAAAGLVIISLACFPGLWLLIRNYRKIERKYICRG